MIHSTTVHGAESLAAQDYLAGWQRARAELKNYQQQLAQERLSLEVRLRRSLLETLLPVTDNFQAAAVHVPADFADHPWTQGVLHIARQLQQVLSDHNLKPIGAVGETFDPAQHEAITEDQATDQPSGTILEVLQTGYRLEETLIRPAKVKVAT
jgi:molecular chaperone GrpE